MHLSRLSLSEDPLPPFSGRALALAALKNGLSLLHRSKRSEWFCCSQSFYRCLFETGLVNYAAFHVSVVVGAV